MAAGEESEEAEDKEHREKRVHEVAYPCWSAVPPKHVNFGLSKVKHILEEDCPSKVDNRDLNISFS